MSVHFARGSAAAMVCVFSAHTALADLTAQEVWSEWRAYMTGVGYTVSGTETLSGGTLSVADATMSMDLPDGEGTVSLVMDKLVFAENGDGTVAVSLPSSFPVRFAGVPEGGEEIDGEIVVTQSGLSMVVAGTLDNLTYNYTATELAVALGGVAVNGEAMPADAARMSITLSNVISSSTQEKAGDLRNIQQRLSADALSYDMSFQEPGSDEGAALAGRLAGLSFEGGGSIPKELDSSDIAAMMAAGFSFGGTFAYSSGEGTMSGTGDGEEFAFASTSQGGSLGVSMDGTNVAYDVSQSGVQMTIQTSDLPFPVALQMAETGFGIDMPITKADDPQDFAFRLKIGDFAVPEQLWGMVDPGGVLPRDPATVILDVAGKAKVLADLFDPMMAESMEDGTPPGELHAMTIRDLQVSAAGAALSGTGDFTFDNSDMVSFDGMPAPTGSANLRLVGANGLIDRLIQMGLVSDQDAMGARMMMGMLAVPGDGPDTLNSEIVINEQGQILANGQRIK